ncbi:MAG: hypothetical protein HZC44_03425 [Geobacter sp.]|nr:hypothetical protein [Geobacter sp.]
MKATLNLTLLALACMTLFGCGGGGDSGGAVDDRYLFPAGTATFTFAAMSTATLPAPISGIDFTVTLPQGMSVTTTSGNSGQIAVASVTAGSALTGTNLAYGSYSASTRTAHLTMATTSNTFRAGEFLRLSCNVDLGSTITLADVKALNSPVNIIRASGYDLVAKSTVNLTDKIAVALGAIR